MKKIAAVIIAALFALTLAGTAAAGSGDLEARVTKLESQVQNLRSKVRLAHEFDLYLHNGLDVVTFGPIDVVVWTGAGTP